MQSGRFFILDNNPFAEGSGAVFRYLGLSTQEKTNKIYHPIYLDIKPNIIKFYFHGYILREDSKELINTCILSLSLMNSGELLAIQLRRLYTDMFPPTYNESVSDELFSYENNDRLSTYSSLKKFDVHSLDNKKISLKKIFLDFMFDCEHSDIFKISPHFQMTYSALRGNFFFKAIVEKVEYDYCLNKLHCYMFREESGFYRRQYEESKRKWLECIIQPNADAVIAKENKWFQDIEGECNDIFKEVEYVNSGRSKNNFKINNSDMREQRNSAAKWFVNRQNVALAFRLFIKPVFLACTFVLFATLSLFIGKIEIGNQGFFASALRFLLKTNFVFIPFFLIFVFIIIFKMRSIAGVSKLILLNLFVILFSIWLFVFNFDILLPLIFDLDILTILIISVSFLVILFFLVYSAQNSRKFIKTMAIIAIGIFYSFNINLIGNSILLEKRLLKDNFLEKYLEKVSLVKPFAAKPPGHGWISTENAVLYNEICTLRDKSKAVDNDKDVGRVQKVKPPEDKNSFYVNSLEKINISYGTHPILFVAKLDFLGLKFNFRVLPSLLFLNTLLTLFISIFIQQVIKNKALTE